MEYDYKYFNRSNFSGFLLSVSYKVDQIAEFKALEVNTKNFMLEVKKILKYKVL